MQSHIHYDLIRATRGRFSCQHFPCILLDCTTVYCRFNDNKSRYLNCSTLNPNQRLKLPIIIIETAECVIEDRPGFNARPVAFRVGMLRGILGGWAKKAGTSIEGSDSGAATVMSQESHGPGPGPIDNRTLGDGRELWEGMVSVVCRERRRGAPGSCLS